MKTFALRRGDVVLVDFQPSRPFETGLTRPTIVVSNNLANARLPICTVIPVTSNITTIHPHELFLPALATGLDEDSKAQVHLIRHISLSRIEKIISHVPLELMHTVDAQLRRYLML